MRIRDFKLATRTRGEILAGAADAKSMTTFEIVENPLTNGGEMSAFACINTDAIDYQGEGILASGVRIANYRMNPAVLYEHGKGPICLPIASSESPLTGDLMIERSDYDMHGTSYFSRTLPIASQLFGLIDEGVLRATSIQVMPITKSIYTAESGTRHEVTEESDLIEWSWCSVGVNPEAVKKAWATLSESFRRAWTLQADHASVVLERGSIGEDRLLEPIRKSLMSFIPSPVASSPGADFTKESTMASVLKHKTKLELRKMKRDDLASMLISGAADYDQETVAQAKSLYEEVTMSPEEKLAVEEAAAVAPAADDAVVTPEPVVEEAAAPEVALPLGASVISEIYAAIVFLIEHASTIIAPVEHETVKAGLTAAIEDWTAALDTVAGIFTTAYPELPALGAAPEVADAEAETETQLKSLLASHRTAGFRSIGLAGAISRIAADQSIPEAQRKSLRGLGDRLSRLIEEAKAAPQLGEMVPLAMHKKLEVQVDDLISKIAKHLLPAS